MFQSSSRLSTDDNHLKSDTFTVKVKEAGGFAWFVGGLQHPE